MLYKVVPCVLAVGAHAISQPDGDALAAAMKPIFDIYDSNGDGTITRKEYDANTKQPTGRADVAMRTVGWARADIDNDNDLDRNDFQIRFDRQVDRVALPLAINRMDTNNDGGLSMDELTGALSAARAANKKVAAAAKAAAAKIPAGTGAKAASAAKLAVSDGVQLNEYLNARANLGLSAKVLGRRFNFFDADDDNELDFADVKASWQNSFNAADADGDGKITYNDVQVNSGKVPSRPAAAQDGLQWDEVTFLLNKGSPLKYSDVMATGRFADNILGKTKAAVAFAKNDKNSDGVVDGADVKIWFDNHDLNADGTILPPAAKLGNAFLKAYFVKSDVNGDGVLDKNDLKKRAAYYRNKLINIKNAAQTIGPPTGITPKDGMDLGEFKKIASQQAAFKGLTEKMLGDKFASWDYDDDGNVDMADKFAYSFDRVDRNGDGKLSFDDVQKAMADRAAFTVNPSPMYMKSEGAAYHNMNSAYAMVGIIGAIVGAAATLAVQKKRTMGLM